MRPRLAAWLVLVGVLLWRPWAGPALIPAAVGGSPRAVVVAPGDSLWSIARSLDPAGDPRDVVRWLIELNDLRSSRVQPGQMLLLHP